MLLLNHHSIELSSSCIYTQSLLMFCMLIPVGPVQMNIKFYYTQIFIIIIGASNESFMDFQVSSNAWPQLSGVKYLASDTRPLTSGFSLLDKYFPIF